MSHEKKPLTFHLLSLILFNRDPYNDLLESPQNRVVYNPLYTLNDQGIFHCSYVPGSKLLILGMVIQPLIGNLYNGYIKPYYKVDDHPLLYGNNGSLDPSTYGCNGFRSIGKNLWIEYRVHPFVFCDECPPETALKTA